MNSLALAFYLVEQPAPKNLDNDHHIDGQTDPMMRIGQAPSRTHRKPAQDKDHSGQEQSQDLAPDMQLEGPERIRTGVVSNEHHRKWYNPHEHDRCDDGMSDDEGVVLRHVSEAVSHP